MALSAEQLITATRDPGPDTGAITQDATVVGLVITDVGVGGGRFAIAPPAYVYATYPTHKAMNTLFWLLERLYAAQVALGPSSTVITKKKAFIASEDHDRFVYTVTIIVPSTIVVDIQAAATEDPFP